MLLVCRVVWVLAFVIEADGAAFVSEYVIGWIQQWKILCCRYLVVVEWSGVVVFDLVDVVEVFDVVVIVVGRG